MPKSVNYDQVAPTYDRRYAEHEFGGTARMLDEFVAKEHAVLEVGCGTGHWVAQLRARGCTAVGLDRSPGMLARAAQNAGNATLVLGRAESLPFPDRSFDRLVVINALHHFDDPARFAGEAHRVLRPGGRIGIVGIDPTQGIGEWFVYRYFPRTVELDRSRYPTTTQIKSWLSAAGFGDCAEAIAERIDRDQPARDYLDRGLLTKESTSQLTLLSDEEFAQGVASIRAAMQQAAAAGEELQLHAHLCLWATFGTAGYARRGDPEKPTP